MLEIVLGINIVGSIVICLAGFILIVAERLERFTRNVSRVVSDPQTVQDDIKGTAKSFLKRLKAKEFRALGRQVIPAYGWRWALFIVGFAWLILSMIVSAAV